MKQNGVERSIGDGEHFVILGRPESGYSLKVRSAMHYKGASYLWLDRSWGTERLFQKHARVQLIPLVFLPDGDPMQDSTPILEWLEEQTPEPSLHPPRGPTRFLSTLLEEYGDEWANKLMFHYRWGYPADQKVRSRTLARGMLDDHPLRFFSGLIVPVMSRWVVKRMVPRMSFAGANENNAPILIESFQNLVAMLEEHFANRSYIFGGRPAFGDFGVWGQLYQASMDPTCGEYMRKNAPRVGAWLERMLTPRLEGPFEELASLEPTLRPLFEREVGPRFLAWDAANARAWDAGEPRTELEMEGRRYYQKTFKYPAANFRNLRKLYASVSDNVELDAFLETTGCRVHLA
ncbi:MAG: glutathione S-transferase family protein [Myxococcota bacterium]|nr:glutathione S-transferase family protein [Myxococcota bacterium]